MEYNYGNEIIKGNHLTKFEGLEKEELLQMDLTINDNRNVLNFNEINPRDFGFNKDEYKCYSTQHSGWNSSSNCYLLQFKTWAYKLEIKVKTDNFYVRHAWSYGKYIKIDKTFNSGDTIVLYMVRLIEFKGLTPSDCDITAWYIPPFMDNSSIDKMAITKEEKERLKKKYLIQNQLNSKNKYIYYQNGLSKFAVDNTLSDVLNHKNPLILLVYTEKNIFNEETGKLFEVFSYNLPSWFEE